MRHLEESRLKLAFMPSSGDVPDSPLCERRARRERMLSVPVCAKPTIYRPHTIPLLLNPISLSA